MSEQWLQFRECKDRNPRIFFPLPTEKGTVTLAKAICSRCPVKGACLHAALMQPDGEFGIWGGTTEDERRRIQALLGPNVSQALTQIHAELHTEPYSETA